MPRANLFPFQNLEKETYQRPPEANKHPATHPNGKWIRETAKLSPPPTHHPFKNTPNHHKSHLKTQKQGSCCHMTLFCGFKMDCLSIKTALAQPIPISSSKPTLNHRFAPPATPHQPHQFAPHKCGFAATHMPNKPVPNHGVGGQNRDYRIHRRPNIPVPKRPHQAYRPSVSNTHRHWLQPIRAHG